MLVSKRYFKMKSERLKRGRKLLIVKQKKMAADILCELGIKPDEILVLKKCLSCVRKKTCLVGDDCRKNNFKFYQEGISNETSEQRKSPGEPREEDEGNGIQAFQGEGWKI
jgi:hypothetical protein